MLFHTQINVFVVRLNPYRETKFSGTHGDRGILTFLVQLTTSRIGNLTRLTHTLLYVMTIHTCINFGGNQREDKIKEDRNKKGKKKECLNEATANKKKQKNLAAELFLENNRMPLHVLRNPPDEIHGYKCKRNTQAMGAHSGACQDTIQDLQ